MERWRDIPGYEGRYQASTEGRVRSLPRSVVAKSDRWGGPPLTRTYRGRLLRPGAKSCGHVTVAIGKGNSMQVHQLVLSTFVGPKPAGLEVLHGPDHNPANNRLVNLRYGTRSENLKDDYARGIDRLRGGR